MSAQTILVVDDDIKIRNLVRNVFEDGGYEVHEAARAGEVLGFIRAQAFDLITLDIHLGAESGLQIARDIRNLSQVPIIMVTGKDDVIDRVVGLEVGADDYITKPFHVREVIARVRSVLRRAAITSQAEMSTPPATPPQDGAQYHFDGMIAAPDRLQLVDRNGEDCALTSGDFRLLKVFLERPKRVLSRDQLMDMTGGLEWSPLDRKVDNQVARLRKKIEHDPSRPKLIKTVRGIGYVLACDVCVVHQPASSARSA